MAREIVKQVGKRAYRYAVERIADDATGKSKRRWRYLGPATGAAPAGEPRTTRDRLLDAFEGLLVERPFPELTISAIGQAAGLAHGTFYRYFADRDAVLDAAVDRIKAALDATEPHLGVDLGTRQDELARIVRWLDALTAIPAQRTALVRTFYLHRTATGKLSTERRERRERQVGRLASYLGALENAGFTRVGDARSLALGIYAAIDGVMRRAIIEDQPLDAETIDALQTIVVRAVFGDER